MNTQHRRAASAEVRKKGDGRTIEARIVTYESTPDSYGSVWAKGCFTESLNRRMPVLAWSHSWEEPIGIGTSWRDGADGPYVTFRISDPDAVPRARQAIAQIGEGVLTDVSVGFFDAVRRDPTNDEMVRWPGVREVITRASLDEVSLVLRAAVAGAQLVGQRSAKSSGWWLARQYAEGRITREQFEAQTALENEVDEALDKVAAMSLRVVEPHFENLSAEEQRSYLHTARSLARSTKGTR